MCYIIPHTIGEIPQKILHRLIHNCLSFSFVLESIILHACKIAERRGCAVLPFASIICNFDLSRSASSFSLNTSSDCGLTTSEIFLRSTILISCGYLLLFRGNVRTDSDRGTQSQMPSSPSASECISIRRIPEKDISLNQTFVSSFQLRQRSRYPRRVQFSIDGVLKFFLRFRCLSKPLQKLIIYRVLSFSPLGHRVPALNTIVVSIRGRALKAHHFIFVP